MKIVIDIPEEEYKRMKEQSMFGRVDIWKRAIKNGKPLPKHHGRIIDESRITSVYYHEETCSLYRTVIDGTNAPTIIEGSDNDASSN